MRRWGKQLEGSADRELPGTDELHAPARRAGAGRRRRGVGIVHGDYRLDNLLIGPTTTRSRRSLDWEMATLGDPLTDLALLLVYDRLAVAAPAARLVADVQHRAAATRRRDEHRRGTPRPAAATSATWHFGTSGSPTSSSR